MKKIRIFSVVTISLLLVLAFFPSLSTYFEIKIAPYQRDVYAIRLTDGSYIYGRISGATLNFLRLKDVYYFQTLSVDENKTNNLISQSSNLLTSPENFMLINRDNISLIERVGDNAKILEIINR